MTDRQVNSFWYILRTRTNFTTNPFIINSRNMIGLYWVDLQLVMLDGIGYWVKGSFIFHSKSHKTIYSLSTNLLILCTTWKYYHDGIFIPWFSTFPRESFHAVGWTWLSCILLPGNRKGNKLKVWRFSFKLHMTFPSSFFSAFYFSLNHSSANHIPLSIWAQNV